MSSCVRAFPQAASFIVHPSNSVSIKCNATAPLLQLPPQSSSKLSAVATSRQCTRKGRSITLRKLEVGEKISQHVFFRRSLTDVPHSTAPRQQGPVMMTGTKIKLVGIGGSLRKASCNSGLLRAGMEYAATLSDVDAIHLDYSKLPLYNGDLEVKEGDVIQYPPEVEEFRAAVHSADAFLFASPEYNYSMSGVLKNAIDWASRPPNCFADRPAAVIGAGGGQGASRSAYHMRQTGVFLDLHFINKPELFVQIFSKPSPFDSEGNLIDEKTRERVHGIVNALRAYTYRLKGQAVPAA